EEDHAGSQHQPDLGATALLEYHLRGDHPEDGPHDGEDSQRSQQSPHALYSCASPSEADSEFSTGWSPSSRSPCTARPSCCEPSVRRIDSSSAERGACEPHD